MAALNQRLHSFFEGLRSRLGLNLPASLEDSLLQFQYARISARVPFLYLAIAAVAFAGSYGSGGPFSWLYHAALPGFFFSLGAVRGLVWYRRRGQKVEDRKLRKRLRNTALIAVFIGLIGSIWTMDAYYATVESRRIMAPIFLFMVVFASVISMLNVPRAAIGAIVAGLTWPTVVMIASDDTSIRSVGLCFGIIAVMMICLVLHNFGDTISNLKMRAELRRLADTDMLTGLANRRAFEQKSISFWQEGAGIPAADFIMIDLDGFKQANDDYGHAAGDAILQEVAKRLRQICQHAVCISRFGGDEFAILSHGSNNKDLTRDKNAAIRTALGLPYIFEGKVINVGASIGTANCPEHGTEISELIKYADRQLYRDKSGGASAAEKSNAA